MAVLTWNHAGIARACRTRLANSRPGDAAVPIQIAAPDPSPYDSGRGIHLPSDCPAQRRPLTIQ
jgi:hypothetical protein